jgi:hypothetical protein
VNLDLGVIECDDGLVNGFIEKPGAHLPGQHGRLRVRRARAALPAGGQCQFPDLVLRLLAAGERVAAFQSDADWFDIARWASTSAPRAEVERNPEKYDLEPLGPQQHDLLATLETPDA